MLNAKEVKANPVYASMCKKIQQNKPLNKAENKLLGQVKKVFEQATKKAKAVAIAEAEDMLAAIKSNGVFPENYTEVQLVLAVLEAERDRAEENYEYPNG